MLFIFLPSFSAFFDSLKNYLGLPPFLAKILYRVAKKMAAMLPFRPPIARILSKTIRQLRGLLI
jgi:hypothetical protein